MRLLIFGLGYTSMYYARHHALRNEVTATVTTAEKALASSQAGIRTLVFCAPHADKGIAEAIACADAILVSIPPDETGDPTLLQFADAIAASGTIQTIVYLSTIGVYGDHAGAWVDEASACKPSNPRSRCRVEAEAAWLALGAQTGKAVHVLRLAGIYGPGQNALVNLGNGTARRIIKHGQVFNRIHVEDIARTIDACLHAPSGGVWNVCDNEPAPAEDVVEFAAKLLGVEPPPRIAFEKAQMSPMARSFYSECKRASNRAMRERLGVELAYPSYREALKAMRTQGDGP